MVRKNSLRKVMMVDNPYEALRPLWMRLSKGSTIRGEATRYVNLRCSRPQRKDFTHKMVVHLRR